MENDHRLNGEPIGYIGEEKETSVREKTTYNGFAKILNLIKVGVIQMIKPIESIFSFIVGIITDFKDFVCKIHFAFPYIILSAAIYWKIIPENILSFGWISSLSGISVVMMCIVIWVNESNFRYLHEQKWGVFWIIVMQTVLQVLTYTNGYLFGHVLGGVLTLCSYPFYAYFMMGCEDDK